MTEETPTLKRTWFRQASWLAGALFVAHAAWVAWRGWPEGGLEMNRDLTWPVIALIATAHGSKQWAGALLMGRK